MQKYAIFHGDEPETHPMGVFAALMHALNSGKAELDGAAVSSSPITCEVHFEDGWSIRPVADRQPVMTT